MKVICRCVVQGNCRHSHSIYCEHRDLHEVSSNLCFYLLKRDAFCKKKQECKCITFFQSKIEEHSGKKS